MSSDAVPTLLVTANVGSIFEDPSVMLEIWTAEFLANIAKLRPKFIGLHCQEVGGKNYEKSMKHVEDFIRLLMSSDQLKEFSRARIFLDEDYSSAENFTALGNLYFIHESVKDVLIWNFKEHAFVPVDGKETHSGNIEAVATKEKAKFPQDFFPECKWSRKGFLRTRWSISGTVFDLINIHLFHDASNFVAMEPFPSVYCKNRRRALEHTLQGFHNDANGTAPYFLFGDFNFRTDTDGVVKKLTEGLTTFRVQNNKNNDHTKLQYRNDSSELVLTVGKKEFNHLKHQSIFIDSENLWLLDFDRELEAFDKYLVEYPVKFPPSYPFEENVSHATSYMQTRCPAWCDRVLLSLSAKSLIGDESTVEYNVMGKSICMGDHKPVFLRLDLRPDKGTVKCCMHLDPLLMGRFDVCRCCQTFASIIINVTDMSSPTSPSDTNCSHYASGMNSLRGGRRGSSGSSHAVRVDSNFLHEPRTKEMLSHDPYTPESVDSRSPAWNDSAKPADKGDGKAPVSPRALKSKLESILRDSERQRTNSEDNLSLRMRRERPFWDEAPPRQRCMSELPRKASRARLIMAALSANRLQSHHSSSDEDWFEFEEGERERAQRKAVVAVEEAEEAEEEGKGQGKEAGHGEKGRTEEQQKKKEKPTRDTDRKCRLLCCVVS